MSDLIIVAIINGIFAILILGLGARINSKVNKVKFQVENSHPINMRVEADNRFDETSAKLDILVSNDEAERNENI